MFPQSWSQLLYIAIGVYLNPLHNIDQIGMWIDVVQFAGTD